MYDARRYTAPDRVNLPDRTWPDRALSRAPIWCSVDLRDGNQALPDPMGHARKKALLQTLLTVGFRQIEIGFPSASQTDFDFARWVVEAGVLPDDVIAQVITQAREPLIARTFDAISGAKRAIVHLYNSTSELQRRVVFGMSLEQVIELAVRGTEWVKREAERHPETQVIFQYSPESFTGTELGAALEVCNRVIEAWGPTPERKMIINLPSTVEMTTPNVFADRIEWMSRQLARRECVTLSVHTHNDRGCGVAAAELAVLAGAERIEGTLLGNGERSGNVDIVTLALNLYSSGIDPGLSFEALPEVVRAVEECTRLPVHPRHPYAGELVFAAFSGSHQDAIHKGMKAMQKASAHAQPGRPMPEPEHWEVPYLPIDPADIGRRYEPVIRINSQSGKSGVSHVLERDFGYRVPRALAIDFSRVLQQLTDARGEELASEEVAQVFEREYCANTAPVHLEGYAVERRPNGSGVAMSATLSHRTTSHEVYGVGDGPIEAFVVALGQLLGRPVELVDYSEHARSEGADAEAIAYVAVRGNGDTPVYGMGRHMDVVSASR